MPHSRDTDTDRQIGVQITTFVEEGGLSMPELIIASLDVETANAV